MATITLKGNEIHTKGDLPAVGTSAPGFTLASAALEDTKLETLSGKKILNIFPSIDTPVCQASLRAFNEKAGKMDGVTVVNISADLPFAFKRFCAAEGLEGVTTMSTFRSSFADDYNVVMTDGPLAGLCSRAVLVLDADNKILHAEQVPEIGQEPDYDAALKAL